MVESDARLADYDADGDDESDAARAACDDDGDDVVDDGDWVHASDAVGSIGENEIQLSAWPVVVVVVVVAQYAQSSSWAERARSA